MHSDYRFDRAVGRKQNNPICYRQLNVAVRQQLKRRLILNSSTFLGAPICLCGCRLAQNGQIAAGAAKISPESLKFQLPQRLTHRIDGQLRH